MGPSALSKERDLAGILLYGILFLFFLQLISEFVEAIYAFGLLGTSLPLEVASVLFLFSPLALVLLPGSASGWAPILLGELMLASRVIVPLLGTRGKMFVSGLGVACFLLLLPTILRHEEEEQSRSGGLMMGLGLSIALLLSIFLKALNSGSDLSTTGWYQVIGWLLAIAAALLLFRLLHPEAALAAGPPPENAVGPGATPERDRSSSWRIAGLCLGLVAVLVICYFAFASPNVIARWTGVDYRLIVSIVVAVLSLSVLLVTLEPRLLAALTPATVLGWNLLFVLSMVLTILAHQISFPSDPGAYPLPEPPATPLHQIPLFAMLVLFPVILLDFVLYARELVRDRPPVRTLAWGFVLGSIYLLFMIFAQVFTTVYDYIPVVGPFFRDKFWFVFLLGGMALMLPALLVRRSSFDLDKASAGLRLGPTGPVIVVLVGLVTVAGAAFGAASPASPPAQQNSLSILTYNIQQGYSRDGLKSYDWQLDLLREADADIIGLQESDTNRIAGGNSDVVRYFADKLDLYSYYGPKTVSGTFGIALLSKYPIENPETFYMYSEGEQTATIVAQVTVRGQTFTLFVTHLGNGGPTIQQQALLQELGDRDNAIVMGDFNFRPGTDQYRLTTTVLEDSWIRRWPQGNDGQGVDPATRIDHIFLSPGITVLDSEYLAGPQSDHPAMMTTVAW
jgi:endonuclease/exonuclease/phosphatase family metal-dependent hydrolase